LNPESLLLNHVSPILETEAQHDPGDCDGCADGLYPEKNLETTFQEFWEAYPKKQNLRESRLAWAELQPSDDYAREIIELVKKRVAGDPGWDKSRYQFIQSPERFIAGERWTDEWVEKELTQEEIEKLQYEKFKALDREREQMQREGRKWNK